MTITRKEFFYSAAVFLFAVLIYLPSLKINFVSDEIYFIKRNSVENVSQLPSLFEKKTYDEFYYRPLPNFISGAITLLFDFNSIYYRIFNSILHAFNAWLLFWLLFYFFHGHPKKILISFFSSMIFAAYPIHDYAVIWHTDLFDRLMFTFYISALIFFIKNNEQKFIPLILFSLSLLCKEMAFSFPLIIFCYSFIIKEKNITNAVRDSAPFLASAAAFILFRIILFDNNIFNAGDAHAGKGIIDVVKNYFLFIGILSFPFYLREVEFLITQNKLILLIPAAALCGIIFHIYKLKLYRERKLWFFILFLLITIAPASRLFMRWYLYLPSAAFSVLVVYYFLSLRISNAAKRAALSILVLIFTFAIAVKELKWIENSGKSHQSLLELKKNFGNEIISAGGASFITFPAKVDDIPLQNLGKDYLFNHYLSDKKLEFQFYAGSYLHHFDDSIKLKINEGNIEVEQIGPNYFTLLDYKKNIKLVPQNNSRPQKILIKITEKDKPLFTFSNGKFIQLKGVK